jgi:hypothetical protein
MASGAVPARLVAADTGACCAALDAGEAGAVSDLSTIQPKGPVSEVAAVLGMMETACGRLASVEEKLGNVPLMQQTLASIMKGQEKMEGLVEKIEESHRESREQNKDRLHEHQLKIQAIEHKLINYETTVKTVARLDKNVSAYVLLAVVGGGILGALFAGLPAWLDRVKHSKASTMNPPALTRGRG